MRWSTTIFLGLLRSTLICVPAFLKVLTYILGVLAENFDVSLIIKIPRPTITTKWPPVVKLLNMLWVLFRRVANIFASIILGRLSDIVTILHVLLIQLFNIFSELICCIVANMAHHLFLFTVDVVVSL